MFLGCEKALLESQEFRLEGTSGGYLAPTTAQRGTSRSDSVNTPCTIPLCASLTTLTVLCLYIPLGLSLLQAVSEAADDTNQTLLDSAIFPLGKPSSLNGSDLLFFIKTNFNKGIP